MVLFSEHVADAECDGYGPVKNAERGEREEAAVIGEPFRFRQPNGAQPVGQRDGDRVFSTVRSIARSAGRIVLRGVVRDGRVELVRAPATMCAFFSGQRVADADSSDNRPLKHADGRGDP